MSDLIPQETVAQRELSLQVAEFEFFQRKAALYASSKIIPKDFQGNVAHCFQVIEMAKHLNVPEMIAFQHCYIIHGKASFSAVFMISCFNTSGRFTPINYEFIGEGDTRSCRATTTIKETGELVVGPEVSIATAKADGWYSKAGSKWKTIPELMLRYRAASWLVKTVAPEIAVGLSEKEEVIDSMPQTQPDPPVVVSDLPTSTPNLTQVIDELSKQEADLSRETVEQSADLF